MADGIASLPILIGFFDNFLRSSGPACSRIHSQSSEIGRLLSGSQIKYEDTSILLSIPLAVFVALIATRTDLRSGKIYNDTTYPAALAGLVFGLIGSIAYWFGFDVPLLGLIEALRGFLLGFTIVLFAHLIGGGGMGDVKLAAALGSLIGHEQILFVLCVVYVMAALVVLTRWTVTIGPIRLLARAIVFLASCLFQIVDPSPLTDEEKAGLRAKVRLGPYFLAGLILAQIFPFVLTRDGVDGLSNLHLVRIP